MDGFLVRRERETSQYEDGRSIREGRERGAREEKLLEQ